MTFFGKLFFFINIVVALALITTCSIMVYTLHVDWSSYQDKETGKKLPERVSDLTKDADSAVSQYAKARLPIIREEAATAVFARAIDARLVELKTGQFTEVFNNGVLDLNTRTPIKAISRDAMNRERNLPGVDTLQAEMDASVKLAAQYAETIGTEQMNRLQYSNETNDFDARYNRMKIILAEQSDQKVYLGDVRVNWDDQLFGLVRRKNQLASRLAELTTPKAPGVKTGLSLGNPK